MDPTTEQYGNAVHQAAHHAGTLALTGADLLILALAGVALMTLGVMLRAVRA